MARYVPIGSIHTFPSGESFVLCVVDDELRWCAFDTGSQNHTIAGLSDIADLENPEFVEEDIDIDELNDDTNMAFDAAQPSGGGTFQDVIRSAIQNTVNQMASRGGGTAPAIQIEDEEEMEEGEVPT